MYPPHIQIVAGFIKKSIKQENKHPSELFNNAFSVENILTHYFEEELFKGLDYRAHSVVRDLLDTLVGREGLQSL